MKHCVCFGITHRKIDSKYMSCVYICACGKMLCLFLSFLSLSLYYIYKYIYPHTYLLANPNSTNNRGNP